MDKELLEAAISAREKAYVPYSKFKVGAAIRTIDGKIFSSCNIENASYGLTVCAERNAIFAAVSKGYKDFELLCVVADTKEPVAPCGACRQVMSEFNIKEVCMANLQGESKNISVAALLPGNFKKSDMEK